MKRVVLAVIVGLCSVVGCAVWGEPLREEVDLELVLAADASGSVIHGQRRDLLLGFAQAFRDADLQRALQSGPLGKVAVVYFEWAGFERQRIVVPWTMLSTTAEIAAFADTLEMAKVGDRGGQTSISGAMLFAQQLFEDNAFNGLRKVVDIASNGQNSEGPPVSDALEALRSIGATVNALTLAEYSLDQPDPYASIFNADVEPLEAYFKSKVIGGPGSFVMAADPTDLAEAIFRKLTKEVAWAIQASRP